MCDIHFDNNSLNYLKFTETLKSLYTQHLGFTTATVTYRARDYSNAQRSKMAHLGPKFANARRRSPLASASDLY